MLHYTPSRPEHFLLTIPQPRQEPYRKFIVTPENMAGLPHITAISGFEGPFCVGCAGVVPLGNEWAVAFAYLSERAGSHMLDITRKVRRVLQAHPATFIEAHVDPAFEEAVRWVEMLGFEKFEGVCRTYDLRDTYKRAGMEVQPYVLNKER